MPDPLIIGGRRIVNRRLVNKNLVGEDIIVPRYTLSNQFFDNNTVFSNPKIGYGVYKGTLLMTVTAFNSGYRMYTSAKLPDYSVGRIVRWYDPTTKALKGYAPITQPVQFDGVGASGFDLGTIVGTAPVVGDLVLRPNTDKYNTNVYWMYPITWRDLEPTRTTDPEGLAWNAILAQNNGSLHWCIVHGWNVVYRLVLDNPTGSVHIDLPDWLYNDPAFNGDGKSYNNVYTNTGNRGFAPNYANAKLIAEHERLLGLVGDYLGDMPSLFQVQMGSLGHWGEINQDHVNRAGYITAGQFPSNTQTLTVQQQQDVLNAYVQHYLTAFGGKCQITCRRNISDTLIPGAIGGYNDSIGDYGQVLGSTQGSIGTWVNGYTSSYNQPYSAVTPDFRTVCQTNGELVPIVLQGGTYPPYNKWYNWASLNSYFDLMKTQCEQYELSILSTPTESWTEVSSYSGTANGEALLKKLGYRLVTSSVSLVGPAAMITAGSAFTLTIGITNSGYAKMYEQYGFEFTLINGSDAIIHTWRDTTKDTRTLVKNATQTFDFNLSLPTPLAAGTYKLAIALIDSANNPVVRFAQTRRSDLRHVILDNVVVV